MEAMSKMDGIGAPPNWEETKRQFVEQQRQVEQAIYDGLVERVRNSITNAAMNEQCELTMSESQAFAVAAVAVFEDFVAAPPARIVHPDGREEVRWPPSCADCGRTLVMPHPKEGPMCPKCDKDVIGQ